MCLVLFEENLKKNVTQSMKTNITILFSFVSWCWALKSKPLHMLGKQFSYSPSPGKQNLKDQKETTMLFCKYLRYKFLVWFGVVGDAYKVSKTVQRTKGYITPCQ